MFNLRRYYTFIKLCTMGICRGRGTLAGSVVIFILFYVACSVLRGLTSYSWLDRATKSSFPDQNKNAVLQADRQIIKFVSYNIWSNYLIKVGSDIKERLDGLAYGVRNYDIVILQEIFVFRLGPFIFHSYASHLVSAMKKQGFIYRISLQESVPWMFGQSNGLAIFSKIPITATKSVFFDDSAILERVNNKGFVYAELEVNKQKMFIVNTHTDAHKLSVRKLQINQLVSTIRTFPKSSYVIAGGDFNVNPNNPPVDGNEEEFKSLVQAMKGAGLRQVFTQRNATHLNGGDYDHVFTSSNLAAVSRKVINLHTKKGKMVSDHYGLAAEFKLLKKN